MLGNKRNIIQYNVYLSIYEIYIAPLQGNYSEALPAYWLSVHVFGYFANALQILSKKLTKVSTQITWNDS